MNNCPNCTAPLKYDSINKSYKCEYCRSQFKQDINKSNLYIYECNKCNSKLLVGANLVINSCIYCSNSDIRKERFDGEYNPGYIIPFRYSIKDVLNMYIKLYKWRFVPNVFKLKNIKSKIHGLYIPTLLYDFNAFGQIEFDAKKISKWDSGNYKYEKNDLYFALRKSKMQLEKIPIYTKDSIIDDVGPYDYDSICEFKNNDLNGRLVEEFSLTKTEANKRAYKKAESFFTKRLKKDLIGYNKVLVKKSSIDLTNTNRIFVLLPLWIFSVTYKNKIYNFTVNGETGKMIGRAPSSITKLLLYCVVSFLVTFILLFIVYYLKVIL